jgi:hypothetical protein
MKVEDFWNEYPGRAIVLETIESQITVQLLQSDFRGPIKVIDSFIWLFSDDLQQTATNATTADLTFLFYSEAFKRIRSGFVLATKGYFVDCNALLRSVFELNKAINAIQHGILTAEYYLSEIRAPSFRNLPQKDQEEAINDHIRKVDNMISGFDDQGIPPQLKESLRIFKSNLHVSVHKSLAGIALNINEFRAGTGGNLFAPFGDMELFGLSVNNVSYLILMYLRNFLRSPFCSPTNRQRLADMATFIEGLYATMQGYYKDVLDYILLKY